jgi:aspartate racemase
MVRTEGKSRSAKSNTAIEAVNGIHEKSVGILGGMEPEATASFFMKIIKSTPASQDQEHFRVIIDNNPKMPSRPNAILCAGPSPVPMMRKRLRLLSRAGVDFIVIPCITSHYYIDDLRKGLSVPIISAIEKTAAAVRRARPRLKTVRILATSVIAGSSFFQEALAKRGIGPVLPVREDQEQLQKLIWRIKYTTSTAARDSLRRDLKTIARRLVKRETMALLPAVPKSLSYWEKRIYSSLSSTRFKYSRKLWFV